MEVNQTEPQAQSVEKVEEPEWKKVDQKPVRKSKQTSPTAWALLITILVAFGFIAAANTGLISDFLPTGSYSSRSSVGMGGAGLDESLNYLGTWVQVLAISIVVTAVSATIAMFAVLTMSANLTNLSKSIDEIKEDLRNR